MNLTFAEEFSSTISLDAELIATPDSGLFWNRGVHPLVTVDNILNLLPSESFTFTAWNELTTYTKFETSRKRRDVVTLSGNIFLSKTNANLNNSPVADTETDAWLPTNIESLRIRAFLWTVDDNFSNVLNLTRKLIENQYIYNLGEDLKTLSNDYSGWAFESKGSDYVKIRINQMSLQADTTDPVTVTVVNQGSVQTTFTLNPNNGLLEFEDVGYTISGKGRFLFVFPSQDVYTNNAYNDPLRYDGFVCYPVNGIGASPQAATYSDNSESNGLNMNVSAYMDSSVYVTNNKIDFSKFLQAQFEYDFLRMSLHNSNVQSNRQERNVTSEREQQLLATELMSLDMNTVARNYQHEKTEAIKIINRTFDKFLHKPKGINVTRKTI